VGAIICNYNKINVRASYNEISGLMLPAGLVFELTGIGCVYTLYYQTSWNANCGDYTIYFIPTEEQSGLNVCTDSMVYDKKEQRESLPHFMHEYAICWVKLSIKRVSAVSDSSYERLPAVSRRLNFVISVIDHKWMQNTRVRQVISQDWFLPSLT